MTAMEKAQQAVSLEGTARQVLRHIDPAGDAPQLTIRTIRKARQGRMPAIERIAIAAFIDDAQAGS